MTVYHRIKRDWKFVRRAFYYEKRHIRFARRSDRLWGSLYKCNRRIGGFVASIVTGLEIKARW